MASRTSRKQPGPNIIRAWLDTVIKPLFTVLTNENRFLVRRNWTWRFRPPKLEFILPVGERVGIAPLNLDQFIEHHRRFRSKVSNHDELVDQLRSECAGVHDRLLQNAKMSRTFDEVSVRAEREGGPFEFGIYRSKEERLCLIAELLVNGIREQPDHYASARFWNKYGSEFFEILPNADRNRLDVAGDNLEKANRLLIDELLKTARELSVRHDVALEESGAQTSSFA